MRLLYRIDANSSCRHRPGRVRIGPQTPYSALPSSSSRCSTCCLSAYSSRSLWSRHRPSRGSPRPPRCSGHQRGRPELPVSDQPDRCRRGHDRADSEPRARRTAFLPAYAVVNSLIPPKCGILLGLLARRCYGLPEPGFSLAGGRALALRHQASVGTTRPSVATTTEVRST